MKKSYKSILLLFVVMILAISAVNAAEIDDTSESAVQAVDEATVDEVASVDVDDVVATDDSADVLADSVVSGKNFTTLQSDIDKASGYIALQSDYLKESGEGVVTIAKDITINGDNHKIDANKNGGIFKIESGYSVTLMNVILINGNTEKGGAIYNDGSLNFISSQISDSNASVGGAIYNTGILTISSGSTLDGNTATTLGGAVYNEGTAIADQAIFTNNKVTTASHWNPGVNSNGGAAIFTAEGSSLDIDKSTFTGNSAPHDTFAYFTSGGAVYVYRAVATTIDDCTFENNDAGLGGAIVFEGFSQEGVAVQNSEFNNNQAWQGAAINVNEFVGNLNIAGNNFTGNDAVGPNLGGPSAEGAFPASGGAVSIGTMQTTDTTVEITDCDFTQNTAEGGAGAISINANTEVAIENCDFIENEASYGIAIVSAGNTKINGSRFIGNKNGFATIYLSDSENSITNSNFSDNEPEWDVASFKGKLTLSNNEMNSDSATIIAYTNDDETPIVSTNFIVTILENGTVTTNNGIATITAKVTDDNNNLIDYRGNIKFIINDEEVIAKYNSTSKLYQASYTLPTPGIYVVNITAPDATFTIKTGAVKNTKGSFYDLKTQIDATTTGSLELGYDFAYTPIIDEEYGYVKGIEISNDISIDGKGHTINGSDSHRIFYVSSYATLTLDNIVLTNGNATLGGAILISNGNIIISNVNLTNNKATKYGGAIYYVNELTDDSEIINCVFENNEAIDGSGGAIAFIDETYSVYSLAITNTNFTNNKAGAAAGAIYVGEETTVYIENSLFDGNEAPEGDAIYNWYGYLYLDGNTINSEDAEIYNVLGFIDSIKVTTFNATVAYGEKVNLTAIITDNNGNLIYDSGFVFLVKGSDYIAKYNATTKKYELKDQVFNLPVGTYDITVNNEQSPDDIVYIHKGILTATPKKGTFSDLQYQINASNGELNLSYNFTYDADFDADSFPKGVVIGDDLTINGNGYTISANGATRIFYFDGYVGVVLNNITLANGKSAKHGGAICAYGADLTVNHVNFVNNTAESNGGAICFWPDYAGDLTVNDCYFENNSADMAGAIYFDMKGHHMTIRDSAFVNNNATRYGGAIYVPNGDLVVNGTDFINNSAIQNYGGAICYWTDDTDLIINGGIFENNSANDASNGFGGAIFFNVADHSLKIDGADFVNNEARNGGAIYILNGNLDTTDTYFIENSATNYGGAIQIWPGPDNSPKYNLTITGGLFENNIANTFGGAIYFYNYQLIIDGTTFANNIATNDGGAIYQAYHNESTIITGTDFINNRADNAGAIFTYGNGITIEGSTFNNNSAVNDYGAIYYKGGKNWLNIDDTKFINNSANNYGALYAIAATGTYARVNVVHSEFTENKAIAGNAGAVFIHDLVEEAYFTDVDFTANTATGIGGAVYVENIPYFTVNDCDFNDNEAVKGSAIFTQANNNASQWTKIINSRFSGNSAVGTIYNEGQIALNGNTINTTYAEIVNYGIITSTVNAVALGNKTVETAEDTYNLTAVLCDDKDNLIFNPDFKFIVNGVEKDFDSFDYEKGYLLADYPITLDHATYLVNATTTGAADLVNKFGIIKNLKIGTFTDLQYKINNTAEGTTLVLPYNFTYNAEIDGDALKAGVVINKALTVDGNGSTISGADAARIFQLNANNINIKNTTFTNGHANTSSQQFADWGGAIYSNGAYKGHVMSDCKFYNNTAYNGGAIYLGGDASDIIGCEFEDNNATTSGGAVFLYGWSDTISDSTFKFNMADELGGAVACYSTEQAVEITNSVFIGNVALKNGGAVSMQNAAGKITDSNFTGNTAYNGGAVYWGSEGGSISGGEFIENEAFGDLGGAIFAEGAGLTITSTFTENYADNGGAIAVFKDATISESTFTNNTAKNYGGAVYVNGSAKLDITKSVMKNNTATVGSSIYSNGTIGSTIVNATILDNKTWNDTGLGDLYVLNATLTDDMGNSIYDPNFRFTVDGTEIADEPLYDDETGLYTLGYVVEKAGLNVISTSYNAINLQVFTGALDIPLANVTEFTVFAFDILEGENATVFVTLIGVNDVGLDSIVTVIVNNKEYAVGVVNGTGNITIEDLAHGLYPVVAMFEDPNYEYTINSTVFNVVENPDFSLNITNPENSTDTTFTIHVPEDAEGYLLVDVDGKKYYAPVENGTATVSVPGLAPGNYSANITYTGDDSYPAVSATADFTVPSNVPDNALTIPETSETNSPTYSISLPSDATGYLEVDVDGTKYVAPLVNGSASITVPGLSEGNHNVTVSYTGDGKYSSVSKDTTLNVHVPVYAITQNKNINVRYSATANYRVLITKDGKAVGAGETVSIRYNGKTYSVRTDSNGYATLKLNTKVKVKKYTITATYKGITVKNTVKVKNIIKAKNKKVKKSRKVTKVRISLLKVNGKVLKNKKIKVKFRYKWYKVKTNKKGVGYFKVKKSMLKKLKVGKKYKYRVTYGKDVVTKKLTIKR